MSGLGWADVHARIEVEVEMDDDAEANAEAIVLAALQIDPRIQQVVVTRRVQVLGS